MSSTIDAQIFDNGMAEIVLNRPQALNAADSSMTQHMHAKLKQWGEESRIKACVLRSSSDRAFCSGGDVKALALALQEEEETRLAHEALGNEYKLIHEVSSMKIPTVSIMNGVTMGFGIGLGCACRYRVVTEKTIMAMPENGIGLFPDVGFAWLMRNRPAHGLYFALTGARIHARDDSCGTMIDLGLGTHFVSTEKLQDLIEDLENVDLSSNQDVRIEECLNKYAETGGRASKGRHSGIIEKLFDYKQYDNVQDIFAALEQEIDRSGDEATSAFLRETLSCMQAACPFSLASTLAHFKSVFQQQSVDQQLKLTDLKSVLMQEYRLATRLAYRGDFLEGVSSKLIRKDNKSAWNPQTLNDVKV
ncbi:hypothetical protein GUITHDRAFT_100480 [Guillardia theta CCMP2712]|uniref:Enoyl-CoA hydratase/isomerase domain-containing protein n=1 Tax=Guillardia theta (strain CCMP2712) TaxID=905079 RepID=L1K0Z9_GUITC|nr:hypothetical protein GUITHDRAFT_100480 [Guillardia theta CCMP2712]EKX54234.1 hypothetical protein GUITHDRAFT_100480 [Guillardia theta CCMP2712]|eukprot:XP_005841214.1 hypothetical protein GUITHDRAFT_100480 [Guillardia theta CCMP2712]